MINAKKAYEDTLKRETYMQLATEKVLTAIFNDKIKPKMNQGLLSFSFIEDEIPIIVRDRVIETLKIEEYSVVKKENIYTVSWAKEENQIEKS